jgi:7-cyano-7-deazaguanine synthase
MGLGRPRTHPTQLASPDPLRAFDVVFPDFDCCGITASSSVGEVSSSLSSRVASRPRVMADRLQPLPPVASRACVLLSGGLDSAACLEFVLSRGIYASALHVDYGQSAAADEQQAATQLAAHYEIDLTVCQWKSSHIKQTGEIVARNAFLLFAATLEKAAETDLLVIGLHSGTPYYDCGEVFISQSQQLLDGYVDGRVRIFAPFLQWTKQDVWQYAKCRSVPISLTYSCETGGTPTCGTCLSCLDRRALDACQNVDNTTQGLRRHA